MTTKKTKLSRCHEIYAEVHLQDHTNPRKVFIERVNEEFAPCKPNLAPSYYQMLNYEAHQKGGVYKHHKGQRGLTVLDITIPVLNEVVVEEQQVA